MKNFKKLLMLAKMGDQIAKQQIIDMYSGLVTKESIVDGLFDDDLRQTLYKTLISCIRSFEI